MRPPGAAELLDAVGAGALATRTFASCSEGERARIMLARALIADAPLLALDEPAAGLDLGGRELLLDAFERTAGDRPGLTTLTVTHHIEELPPSTSHALLVRGGRIVAAGPLDEALTDETLSECFGLPFGSSGSPVGSSCTPSDAELHDRRGADDDDQRPQRRRRKAPPDARPELAADHRADGDQPRDPPVDRSPRSRNHDCGHEVREPVRARSSAR